MKNEIIEIIAKNMPNTAYIENAEAADEIMDLFSIRKKDKMEDIIKKARELRHEYYPHGKDVAEEIYNTIIDAFDGNMQHTPTSIHYFWKNVIKELER